MKRSIEVEIIPTGKELGIEFSKMDSDEQAICLNEIADQFNKFGSNQKKLKQLYFISVSEKLTIEAKDFIKELNNYVNNKD